jgi:FrmR/RcnR family transcriptional regulator, repressor of frmRAB operon
MMISALKITAERIADSGVRRCITFSTFSTGNAPAKRMAHTTEEKKKLLTRVNRLQGQLEGIRIAIEQEQECASVLQQIAACRGAINSLLVEIIDGEIRFHVLSKNSKVDSREAKAAENLVEILHRYIK